MSANLRSRAAAIATEDRSESSTSVPYLSTSHILIPKRLWGEAASVAAMSDRGHGQGAVAVGMEEGQRRTDSDPGKINLSVSVPHSLFDPLESQVTPESTVTNATRTISPPSSKPSLFFTLEE
jgi:hypothetical protein